MVIFFEGWDPDSSFPFLWPAFVFNTSVNDGANSFLARRNSFGDILSLPVLLFGFRAARDSFTSLSLSIRN